MKNLKILFILSMITGFISFSNAQYCIPPAWATGPYTGITNVTLVNLNNSSTINDGGSEVYTYWDSVNVPALTISTQYTISVTTQIIGSGNNSRVWIDWNQDQDFNDAGEEVAAWNSQPQGTLTANFTVPSNALTGTTRMRVYTDMDENQGHITPEPCGYLNYPNHQLMQHGEVEDYDVSVNMGSGIPEEHPGMRIKFLQTSGQITIDYRLEKASEISIAACNLLGQKIQIIEQRYQSKGQHTASFDMTTAWRASGMLIFQISVNNQSFAKKLWVIPATSPASSR